MTRPNRGKIAHASTPPEVPPAVTPDPQPPPPAAASTVEERHAMKAQIETGYPGTMVEVDLMADRLRIYNPNRWHVLSVEAARLVYPPRPSPFSTAHPSPTDPPSGADSWTRHQRAQARQAETTQKTNPQLPFLQSLVAPWHDRGWDVELTEEVSRLGELVPKAQMMNVSWQLLQEAQREWEYRCAQLDALPDADQAISQAEKGVTIPAKRVTNLSQVLRVNLEPSRSGADFVSPPEHCRRMRRRVEQAMAEAATKAEQSVGAPVAPAPRALPPEPSRPAPAQTQWNPFAPEHLGFTPGKV